MVKSNGVQVFRVNTVFLITVLLNQEISCSENSGLSIVHKYIQQNEV